MVRLLSPTQSWYPLPYFFLSFFHQFPRLEAEGVMLTFPPNSSSPPSSLSFPYHFHFPSSISINTHFARFLILWADVITPTFPLPVSSFLSYPISSPSSLHRHHHFHLSLSRFSLPEPTHRRMSLIAYAARPGSTEKKTTRERRHKRKQT